MAKFFIDAGHGGTETGAVGHGMIEKNINLIVAQEVKRILELNGQLVLMSRSGDVTLDLTSRGSMANQYGADYGVSIHHNDCNGVKAGSEVYCSVRGGKGKILAEAVSAAFTQNGRTSKVIQRGSETTPGADYYAIIKKTSMPFIISEFGYMDSGDYINFDTDKELKEEARMIATGCLNVVGVNPIKLASFVTPQHWAQDPYEYLKARGILIKETRLMTR